MFIALPLICLALGDFPRRTFLKEAISILTILAFFLMLGQFYLTRGNTAILIKIKMSKILKVHKFIGYVFIPVLLLHPFLIVLPRFFESGVSPMDAFITLITTFNCTGIILGMFAWALMLTIGLTSLLRNKLPLSYKAWRVVHGVLSVLFISLASWHVTNMGRHMDTAMSVLVIILAGIAVLLILKTYFLKQRLHERKISNEQ